MNAKIANCMRRLGRPRGQVLIYLVMILVVLLVVGIFIFDLQYFIRLRAKTQTGADAAAMTAAAWQGRTLNMIGEINLLKASTVMLGALPGGGGSGIEDMDELLSQVQTRLSYVGPLLGYAAAQQAAKKNGLREVPEFTAALSSHAREWVAEIYPGVYSTPYMGYDWIDSYQEMLERVAGDGIAAKPVNTRYLREMPMLRGAWANRLSSQTFYNAVDQNLYCWFILQSIDYEDEIDFDDMSLDLSASPYFVGSEFLPLYVDFVDGLAPSTSVTDMLPERGLAALPATTPGIETIRWAVFETTSLDDFDWGGTGNYGTINQYLRSNMQRKYEYCGAAARVLCRSQPSLITGNWAWQHGESQSTRTSLAVDPNTGERLWGSRQEFAGRGASFSAYSNRLESAESRLEDLRNTESVVSIGAAKPFGELDGAGPHAASIILPVFTDVRLIPAWLVPENDLDRVDGDFIRFLIAYFGSPNYPDLTDDERAQLRAEFPRYYNAIEDFLNRGSDFRQGWQDYEEERRILMAGEDGILGTDDDVRDPCLPPPPPPPPPGGGPGGPGPGPGGPGRGDTPIPVAPPSDGGPPILH